jgi:phosphonate transport system substrate-binding protein
MDAELQGKIKDALLKIQESEEGKALLIELFNMYGFEEATDSDYDVIRTTAETMNVDLKEGN